MNTTVIRKSIEYQVREKCWCWQLTAKIGQPLAEVRFYGTRPTREEAREAMRDAVRLLESHRKKARRHALLRLQTLMSRVVADIQNTTDEQSNLSI